MNICVVFPKKVADFFLSNRDKTQGYQIVSYQIVGLPNCRVTKLSGYQIVGYQFGSYQFSARVFSSFFFLIVMKFLAGNKIIEGRISTNGLAFVVYRRYQNILDSAAVKLM